MINPSISRKLDTNVVKIRPTTDTSGIVAKHVSVHAQTMHVRLIDGPDGEVSPVGGFTIAYRSSELTAGHVTARYAYAECSHGDNYCRKIGRKIAAARLHGNSVDFSASVAVNLPVGTDMEAALFRVDDRGTVEVKDSVFDMAAAVLRTFIDKHLTHIYGDDDVDLHTAVIWQGRVAFLDLAVISPPAENTVEELGYSLGQVHTLATKLDSLTEWAPDGQARELLAQILEISAHFLGADGLTVDTET